MTTIPVTRAPLNIYASYRVALSDDWVDLYTVPDYLVDALDAQASVERTVTDIVTHAALTNESNAEIQLSVRVVTDSVARPLLTDGPAPPNTLTPLAGLRPMQFKTAEVVQAKLQTGQTGVLHFSVLRQLDPNIQTVS